MDSSHRKVLLHAVDKGDLPRLGSVTPWLIRCLVRRVRCLIRRFVSCHSGTLNLILSDESISSHHQELIITPFAVYAALDRLILRFYSDGATRASPLCCLRVPTCCARFHWDYATPRIHPHCLIKAKDVMSRISRFKASYGLHLCLGWPGRAAEAE